MDARALTKALDGRWGDSSGSASCPVPGHTPDKNFSLSISNGDNGRVLVRCHKTCSQAQVIDALKARGLWNSETKEGDFSVATSYDYNDEDGTLLFQVCRLIPKDFRQRRPDGQGGWIWKTKGVRKVPYRLFELQARAAHDTVLIVEGEKDVDRLADLGFVATCNAGGAGKWQTEINQHFKGKTCFILADNDEAGVAHAEDVAAKLRPIAHEVRIVSLPGLPEKGDVSHWLDAGNDHRKLVDICKAAAVWSPGEPEEPVTDPLIDPFAKLAAPPLAAGIMPEIIERFARREAAVKGVAFHAPAMASLTVAAAAIPDHVRIKVKVHEAWQESARLWLALIGPVSAKKSPRRP